MKTEKFASSREIVFVNTLKFTANTMMAMLFMVLTFCSCSKEVANHHPAQASNLLGSIEETNGLGWAEIDVEANATDANNENLSAAASVRYEGEKEVMVENEEELGLPVTATGDGTTFKTNDNNVITRTENHSASKGVTLNVAGGEWKGGTLGERFERNDSIYQEVLANLSDEAFATTSALPESKIKEWRDSKTSTIRYYRVYVRPAAPVEPEYRLRWEIVEIDGNDVYCGVVAEKSIDGQTWEKIDEIDYFMAMSCGNLKPQVNGAKIVTSFDFTTSESKAQLEPMAPRKGEGIAKGFDVLNTIAEDNIWSNTFNAPMDADNKTALTIGGAQAVRVYEPVWHNPETGEVVKLDTPFTAEVVTTVNKVDEATGLYTITREVRFNGQFVNSETGTAQLQLAQ
jgi:hypothetical protein